MSGCFCRYDGAKCLPVKAPRDTEPVILKGEQPYVISVYGLARHWARDPRMLLPSGACRSQILNESLQKMQNILNGRIWLKLALSPCGGRKSVTNEIGISYYFE